MNKNILYSLGSNIASKVVILLVNIISYRLLDPKEYGAVSLLLVMAATISAVSGMGASVAVNSLVAKEGKSDLTFLFVKYNYIISIIMSFIMAIIIYLIYLNSVNTLENWQVFSFIFAFSLFSSFNSISEAILVGFKSFKRVFISNTLNAVIFIPICFILIFKLQIFGVLISLLAYRFFLSSANFYTVSKTKLLKIKPLGNYNKQLSIKFKELTLPVVLSGLLVAPVIGFAFKILAGQDHGLENLASFNIIYQIYLVAIFVPNALNGFLISYFSKGDQNFTFYKIAKYNLIFSMVVSAILFLSQDVIYYIIGDSNINLVRNYNIMLATIVLFSINAVFASYWPSKGKAWFGFAMNAIWGVTLLITTFLLSKNQIAEALSWAFLVSYLILTVVQFFSYRIFSNYAKK